MEIVNVNDVKRLADIIGDNVKKVIIGKDETIKMLIAAMLASGHVLLEDVPGSGKTMLAKTIAKTIDAEFKRVQMTPDLLPADITGINFFNLKTSEFQFIRGPVFTNILIADEINRATPKTQAGLLECMEEGQVTIDGITYKLANPFLVIATENPIDTQGVFPLPEAQIDRFMVKLSMTYPDHESMCNILKIHMNKSPIDEISSVANKEDILSAIEIVKRVKISDDLVEYIVNIVERTRNNDKVVLGMSQRGGLALASMSKSVAAINGRDYVIPDDIKQVVPFVCGHRLILKNSERIKENAVDEILKNILERITVPTEEF